MSEYVLITFIFVVERFCDTKLRDASVSGTWLITNSNTGMVLQRDTFRFSYDIILMFFNEKYVNKYFYDNYISINI